MPIGIFPDFNYESQECTISRGTMLFLFTDGLTEAMNHQHQQFGRERIMETLNQSLPLGGQEGSLLQALTDKVQQFVDGAEQSDDLTMLAIRYMPVDVENSLHERLTLKNDIQEVAKLNEFIKQTAERIGLDAATSYKVRLALEEAVVNVISYAYHKGTQGEVTVEMMFDGKHLRMVVADDGIPFDPTMTAKPDTTLSIEDRPVGKMGILLMRELMDTINYERIDGKNILRMELLIQ